MQTRSSLKLTRDQASNPASSTNTTPKGGTHRSSKLKVENSNFEEHLPPVATMADNRTMAEMLRTPTEECAEAIVVPLILAEQFELKHSLINMMTSEQFFELEMDNPHDHIRWFNKITSTIKYRDVPNSVIKLILFPFSLAWTSRQWLEKEPPRSITTWDDLVSKFINEFFPPHELQTSGFTELHQLDTFYNVLNPADQDSLNAAAGGNLLEKSPQDALTIIENKSKFHNSRSKPIASQVKACDVNSNSEIAKLTHAVNQQTSAVTTAMTAMLKQLQATQPLAPVKVVEETFVTCEATGNYNQGNLGYPPQGVANQMRPPGFAQTNVQKNQNQFGPPQGFNRGNNFNQEQSYQATTQPNQNFHLNELEKIKRMNEVSMKAMQNQINMVKNELRNKMKTSIQTSLSNQTNAIKNMMGSLLQMNTASTSGSGSLPSNTVANPKGEFKAITTRSGLVNDGPTIPTPPKSITLKVGEHVEETYTDRDLVEYTIKVPPPPLPEKHRDPGKFLIPCGFSELKCNALADLGASINLMPLSVWKELGLPKLIPTRMTLELANRAISTPDGIARDVFVPVGKFTFPADFVVVDYESDPRVPLILGKPFLRTACTLIDVHGEEMILRDGDKRLTLNMKHDTATYSNHPQRESVNLINIFNVSSKDFLEVSVSNQPSGNPTFSIHQELTLPKVTHEIHDSEGCNVLSEKLLDIDSINDIHPHSDDNPLSGSTTYSSNSLLEEFTDELACITYPSDYDDNI
nr:reverse transcriptase domain-containing protein [Tanacetum cinerariifolium]